MQEKCEIFLRYFVILKILVYLYIPNLYDNMGNIKRKGRDLAFTVKELINSPRMKIAVGKYLEGDTSFMTALLTELGMEAEIVMRNAVIRKYKLHKGLDEQDLIYAMKKTGVINSDNRKGEDDMRGMPKKDVNECNTYNLYFGLSKEEVQYYLAEHKNPSIKEEEKKKLFDSVLRSYGLI